MKELSEKKCVSAKTQFEVSLKIIVFVVAEVNKKISL